jgi:ribosomal-protein-alanine N-acetyltransferase
MTFALRRLDLSDLDAIDAIERVSYPTPWTRASFAAELGKPHSRSLGAVADDGALLGYVILSRYVDAWHVMNVAVAPVARRAGIATALLEGIFEATRDEELNGYTLEVRVSNDAAIALYERLGFHTHGIRRGYYTDNREDAMIMWRNPVQEASDT